MQRMSRIFNKDESPRSKLESRPRFNTSEMALFERLWKGTFQAIVKEQNLLKNSNNPEDKHKNKALKSVVTVAIGDKSGNPITQGEPNKKRNFINNFPSPGIAECSGGTGHHKKPLLCDSRPSNGSKPKNNPLPPEIKSNSNHKDKKLKKKEKNLKSVPARQSAEESKCNYKTNQFTFNQKKVVEGEIIHNLPLVEKLMCSSESGSTVKMKMKIQLELPMHGSERSCRFKHVQQEAFDSNFSSSPEFDNEEGYFQPSEDSENGIQTKRKVGSTRVPSKDTRIQFPVRKSKKCDLRNKDRELDVNANESSQDELSFETQNSKSLKAEDVVIVYETPGMRRGESPILVRNVKSDGKKRNHKTNKEKEKHQQCITSPKVLSRTVPSKSNRSRLPSPTTRSVAEAPNSSPSNLASSSSTNCSPLKNSSFWSPASSGSHTPDVPQPSLAELPFLPISTSISSPETSHLHVTTPVYSHHDSQSRGSSVSSHKGIRPPGDSPRSDHSDFSDYTSRPGRSHNRHHNQLRSPSSNRSCSRSPDRPRTRSRSPSRHRSRSLSHHSSHSRSPSHRSRSPSCSLSHHRSHSRSPSRQRSSSRSLSCHRRSSRSPSLHHSRSRTHSRSLRSRSRSRGHMRGHIRATARSRKRTRSRTYTRSRTCSSSSGGRNNSGSRSRSRSLSYSKRSRCKRSYSRLSTSSSSSSGTYCSSECDCSMDRRTPKSTSSNSSYCRSRSSSCSHSSSLTSHSSGSSLSSSSTVYHVKVRRTKSYRKRSPSIVRRRGSPSWLKKRRITSARKRPIPYHRPTPSISSCSSCSGSRSPSAKYSPLPRFSKNTKAKDGLIYKNIINNS